LRLRGDEGSPRCAASLFFPTVHTVNRFLVMIVTMGRGRQMADILRDIEREWIAELGPKQFADLKALLTRVWESRLLW
jgi:hypothetical protein